MIYRIMNPEKLVPVILCFIILSISYYFNFGAALTDSSRGYSALAPSVSHSAYT